MGKAETTAPANGAAPSSNARPKAKVWCNMGKNFELPDGNGNTETVFVSAFGFAVDTSEKPTPYTGKNDRMRQMSEAKIMLWTAFFESGAGMEAGTSLPVAGLDIELRRVGEAQDSAPGQNLMLEQIAASVKIG
jgi:hypothetical protein